MTTQGEGDLINIRTVLSMVGLRSRTSIYALMRRDVTFPRPVRGASEFAVMWRRHEVTAWIESRPRVALTGIGAIEMRHVAPDKTHFASLNALKWLEEQRLKHETLADDLADFIGKLKAAASVEVANPHHARGENHGRAKISDARVTEMRQLHADGWGYRRLSYLFPEIGISQIKSICRRDNRK